MKQEKDASTEFGFIRDKLEHIATLFMKVNSRATLVEVAFMIGCLQNICHDNYLFFKEDDDGMDKCQRKT